MIKAADGDTDVCTQSNRKGGIVLKKIITLLIVMLCSVSLPGSCFAEEKSELGLLTPQGVSEDELNENLQDVLFNVLPFTNFKFFDTFNSLISALSSGIIEGIETDEFVANYVFSHMDGFTRYQPDEVPEYQVGYSMLLREEDTELRDRISDTISEMKKDGTVDALKERYIDDCIAGEEPEAVVPEEIEGADVLRVAVTGDRPPMDYFSASDEPIGFNTAILAEIAKRLGMNVEWVSVDSGARAFSLASGQSDVVFWSLVGDFNNWEKANEEDQPEHTILTEPYLTGTEYYVIRQDSPLAEE